IHEARVGGTDLARGVLGLFIDDLPGSLARQIVEHVEHAIARLIGRDLRVLSPCTVGVIEEVVSRRDAPVHAGGIEAETAILRLCRGRGPRALYTRARAPEHP